MCGTNSYPGRNCSSVLRGQLTRARPARSRPSVPACSLAGLYDWQCYRYIRQIIRIRSSVKTRRVEVRAASPLLDVFVREASRPWSLSRSRGVTTVIAHWPIDPIRGCIAVVAPQARKPVILDKTVHSHRGHVPPTHNLESITAHETTTLRHPYMRGLSGFFSADT